MTREEIEAKLIEIVSTEFRVPREKVKPEATFRGNLGMDSLDAVDLIYLVSREFGLKADVEAFRDLDTVQKVVDYLARSRG